MHGMRVWAGDRAVSVPCLLKVVCLFASSRDHVRSLFAVFVHMQICRSTWHTSWVEERLQCACVCMRVHACVYVCVCVVCVSVRVCVRPALKNWRIHLYINMFNAVCSLVQFSTIHKLAGHGRPLWKLNEAIAQPGRRRITKMYLQFGLPISCHTWYLCYTLLWVITISYITKNGQVNKVLTHSQVDYGQKSSHHKFGC